MSFQLLRFYIALINLFAGFFHDCADACSGLISTSRYVQFSCQFRADRYSLIAGGVGGCGGLVALAIEIVVGFVTVHVLLLLLVALYYPS